MKTKTRPTKDQKATKHERRNAFETYVTRGKDALTPHQEKLISNRALGSSPTAGGVTVPNSFLNLLEAALKQSSFLDVATVIETETGAALPHPSMNDSANIGELLTEGSNIGSSVDPAFGVKTLKAYKFSSKPINISNALVQDAGEILFPVLAQKLAERCINAAMPYFINGTGVDQPAGFVSSGTKGVDAAVSSITYANLIGLIRSVDKRFRSSATFAMNDDTLLALQGLTDTAGNPILRMGYNEKQKPILLGFPVNVVNEMSDIGAGKVSVAFGNFQKYIIRLVKGAELKRLNETFADMDQTGFILYMRMDGSLLDVAATLSPVKYILHAAS